MDDAQLMAAITGEWGDAIQDAIADSPIAAAFIAALAANESNGDVNAQRLESSVLAELMTLTAGRTKNFGSITLVMLAPILYVASANLNPVKAVAGKMLDLATSWGPTQIMGYQTIGTSLSIGDLEIPEKHFPLCVKILTAFMAEWHLQATDFEGLFRCWNTGRATGQTTDPHYVSRGLARMQIYNGLQRGRSLSTGSRGPGR